MLRVAEGGVDIRMTLGVGWYAGSVDAKTFAGGGIVLGGPWS